MKSLIQKYIYPHSIRQKCSTDPKKLCAVFLWAVCGELGLGHSIRVFQYSMLTSVCYETPNGCVLGEIET